MGRSSRSERGAGSREQEREQIVATSSENRAAFCLAGAHLDLWQEVCTIRTDIGDAITWRIYTNVFGEKLACHAQRQPLPSESPCVCVSVLDIGIYKSINEIYTHILCYVLENLLDFWPGRS